MAAGKHRNRIRCLTWARIVAASVVALVFAATMVVVVLTHYLAPDSVRLSVTHGHIQSAELLWSMSDVKLFHLRKKLYQTIIFYKPAEQLTVWVSMDAHVPSGRAAAAHVCVHAVHVLDMPNAPSFDGMVKIATINNTVASGNGQRPCKEWDHRDNATMQLDRWITLDDPLMLCYISQKYGGINDFTALLEVEMEVLYDDYPKETTTTNTSDIHYCWPVTIGTTRRTRSEAITCKPSRGINYTSNALVLACDHHLTKRQRSRCARWSKCKICC